MTKPGEEWKDGTHVAGERRWSMRYLICNTSPGHKMCAECGKSVLNSITYNFGPCKEWHACTVRPSNFEESK